ncbi:MAG: MBL fold metallo-hydrolase [Myxococcota bacterium]|nr:MBL fold metallo-hydrolase [Myxococcota bacterium]MEC8425770.1 MBL fold metallo-hydrolase [Myxococcota bacterium]
MKSLHRPDLFGWSAFDEARNVDFNGTLWLRPGGNVVVDPMPLTPHDRAHLDALGGVALIVVTNSDHLRAAVALAADTGARLAAPCAEQATVSAPVDLWLRDGDEPVPGLRVLELGGSKTAGELALLLDGHTLVCGDLVRGQRGGSLNLLPTPKLSDLPAARASIERLAGLADVDAVIVGDGWPVFRDGRARLAELAAALAD